MTRRTYGRPFRKQDNEPRTVRDSHGYILADCQTAGDADAIIAALNGPPAGQPDWQGFALAILAYSRDDLGDIDGGTVQDAALEHGLLVKVEAQAPCGEGCRCAEYGEFPHDCYRYSAGTLQARAARS